MSGRENRLPRSSTCRRARPERRSPMIMERPKASGPCSNQRAPGQGTNAFQFSLYCRPDSVDADLRRGVRAAGRSAGPRPDKRFPWFTLGILLMALRLLASRLLLRPHAHHVAWRHLHRHGRYFRHRRLPGGGGNGPARLRPCPPQHLVCRCACSAGGGSGNPGRLGTLAGMEDPHSRFPLPICASCNWARRSSTCWSTC
jgi:hypothetical protein